MRRPLLQSSIPNVYGTRMLLGAVDPLKLAVILVLMFLVGVETISHLYDNKRITIMFCSFGPEPIIVRLFGQGTVYEVPIPEPGFGEDVHVQFGSKQFEELVPAEKRLPAIRAAIKVDIHKAQKSSGYGVPIMQFVNERDTLSKWGHGLTGKVLSPFFYLLHFPPPFFLLLFSFSFLSGLARSDRRRARRLMSTKIRTIPIV